MQSSLTDFGDGKKPEPKKLNLRGARLATASPDASLENHSCPWCLHPEITDESCDYCHAVIPVNADWYQEGKKICI